MRSDASTLQPLLWRKARIADRGRGGAQVFTVTHPFHPLRGQSFELLVVRNNWGGDRVSYLDIKGRLRTLPVEWTDVHAPDLVVTVGAGRAFFRADLLRQLRRLIDQQMARREVT
jgi:hypothetical protein